MTNINEGPNDVPEAIEKGPLELKLELLALMRNYMESEYNKEMTILTEGEIDFLCILAEKNIRNQSNIQNLTSAQRVAKTNLHKKIGKAFSDIDRLVKFGFIGPGFVGMGESWNPSSLGSSTNRPPYDNEIWRKEFPVQKVCNLVAALVSMFGDDYAIPLARAIQDGLSENEYNADYQIEVPVIKKGRSRLPWEATEKLQPLE